MLDCKVLIIIKYPEFENLHPSFIQRRIVSVLALTAITVKTNSNNLKWLEQIKYTIIFVSSDIFLML